MALTPALTRSTSLPELSRLGNETLPRNLARSASLLDVTTPTLGTVEPQNPDGISSAPSILESGARESSAEPKSNAKPKKIKESTKKSNKISTEKKAMLHLAAVTGAVTIGAALAPFTLGFSLLPTVFVVMYGNASAMAMYGGSQFVTGEQEKKQPEPKRAASTPTPHMASKHPFPFPPLAALPRPNDSKDTETGNGVERGDIFNNCFNTVNHYHNNWYVFINAPSAQAGNLIPEERIPLPTESNGNNMGMQTTQGVSIDRATQAFADAGEVTVIEIPAHERQERLKILISEYREQADPRLSSLFNLLHEEQATCAQMVEITGKDGATAYAIIPQGEQLVAKAQDRGTQVETPADTAKTAVTIATQTDEVHTGATETIGSETIKGYTCRKWQVNIPTPVSLTNGAQTGSNYTQGARHNLSLGSSAGPNSGLNAGLELGSAVIPKGDIFVPHGQDRGTQVEGIGDSLNKPISTQTIATQTDAAHIVAATEAMGAETIKGYTGRKWQVNIPTPVSLTHGAQTGSNYTQGPRHNLSSELGPVAVIKERGQGIEQGVQIQTPVLDNGFATVAQASIGTQMYPESLARDSGVGPLASLNVERSEAETRTFRQQIQLGQSELAKSTATPNGKAETAQGYTGRKWQVNIPTPVSLTHGAQTGSNYIQGPRHNLSSGQGLQLSSEQGVQTQTPVLDNGFATVAQASVGTQMYPEYLASDSSVGPLASLNVERSEAETQTFRQQIQLGQSELAKSTAAPNGKAETAQGYTGRKWQVNIPTPVSLTHGAQTGSNYIQGPRHNLSLGQGVQTEAPVLDNGFATVVLASVGTQTYPESLARDSSVGPLASLNVERSEAETQTFRQQIQLDQSELAKSTAVPNGKAETAQGYTGRKWQVNIPTPVSLTQGAQTGSNYTQGPKRNLSSALVSDLGPELVSALDSVLGSPELGSDLGSQRVPKLAPTAVSKNSNISIGAEVLPSVERSEAEIRVVRKQIQINKAPVEAAPVDTPLKRNVTAERQESAAKPALNLDKIESRIVGRAGGHIQYKVPKFLDRPEAGTFMGSWRPIPESLQGKRDSVEFAAWRENDLAQYLKSLNTKVLLTQGAVSMRGQNHFAGKMNNVRERAEIKSQLTPMKHMNRADSLQFTGLNSSNGRTHLLETPSGKLRVTPPVTLSNLVLAP